MRISDWSSDVCSSDLGATDAAAAALSAAGILARVKGKILWCMTQSDLFAPALALAGLDPDRVIYVEARHETSPLSCFDEGLRHGGLGGVIAEAARLSLRASRRLQLPAARTGTLRLAHPLRPRRQG